MNRPSTSRGNGTKPTAEFPSSHLHRRYFIGPQPEKVIAQAIDPESTHDLLKSHAIRAFFSSSEPHSPKTNFVQLNDDPGNGGTLRKKVVDDVWKRSKWGSYLTERKHAKEVAAHPYLYNSSQSKWVGESFRVGTIGDPSVEEDAVDIIQETQFEVRERMSTNLARPMVKMKSEPLVPTLSSIVLPELSERANTEPVLSATATAPRKLAPPQQQQGQVDVEQTRESPDSTTGLLEPPSSTSRSRRRVKSLPPQGPQAPLVMKASPSHVKSDAHVNVLRKKGKGKARQDEDDGEQVSVAPPEDVLCRGGSDVRATSAGATIPPPEPEQQDSMIERHDDDGVVLRDRMLVRVTYSKREDLDACFDEQQMRSCSDLQFENWAEFLVVWRDDQIEFYEDYSFRAREWVNGHKRLSYTVKLKTRDKIKCANLSLFSFVDMTFCLTCPRPENEDSTSWWFFHHKKRGTSIFVMKVKSRTRAVDWIWKLWRYLGGRIPNSIDIVSPIVESKVTINLPELDRIENDHLLHRKLAKDEIISLCIGALREHEEWKWVIDYHTSQGKEMELAWRMDTMLDWVWLDHDTMGDFRAWAVICGVAFIQSTMSAQLEIRMAEHFPSSLLLTEAESNRRPKRISLETSESSSSAGGTFSPYIIASSSTSNDRPTPRKNCVTEPDSIEGYLLRIRPTTQFKQQLYLTVHDGCLFSIDPSHAHPPDPPVPPPPGEDWATFAWRLRRSEVGRAAHQLSHANAVCELRQVIAVRRAFQLGVEHLHHHHKEEEPVIGSQAWVEQWTAEEQVAEEDEHDEGGDNGLEKAEDKSRARMRRSFELLFKSGLIMRFETYSCKIAIEWINHLRSLMFYWKQRHLIDAKEEMDLATTRRARVTPRVHAFLDDNLLPPEAPPDLSAPMPALGTLYNWCVLEGCKPILRGGRVYSRRGLRGQFKYVQLFLIRGELLRFRIQRTAPFYAVTTRKIGLVDAYVCSGYLAGVALPSDQYHPNAPATPRRYQDGLEADDPDEDLLFVIWYRSSNVPGSEEAIAASCSVGGASAEQVDQGKRSSGSNAKVPTLSAKRKLVVFRTRSKLERDAWCWAINCEIERLARSHRERETYLRQTGSLAPRPR